MPIEEHPFHLYEQSLEIFPERYSNDPFVVYHGTSILNSERIENGGFQSGIPPFDIAAGNELVNLLRRPEFLPYDTPKGFFNSTTANGLEHYIQYIQSGNARLSFTSLSYAAANFASGELKGGQALRYIGEARLILHQAVFHDIALRALITIPILNMLGYYELVQNNLGVVYAVRIPGNLENFILENNIIYTSMPILPLAIIGKVIIRQKPDISFQAVNNKLKSKLENATPPVGLQILFGRKFNNGEFDLTDF